MAQSILKITDLPPCGSDPAGLTTLGVDRNGASVRIPIGDMLADTTHYDDSPLQARIAALEQKIRSLQSQITGLPEGMDYGDYDKLTSGGEITSIPPILPFSGIIANIDYLPDEGVWFVPDEGRFRSAAADFIPATYNLLRTPTAGHIPDRLGYAPRLDRIYQLGSALYAGYIPDGSAVAALVPAGSVPASPAIVRLGKIYTADPDGDELADDSAVLPEGSIVYVEPTRRFYVTHRPGGNLPYERIDIAPGAIVFDPTIHTLYIWSGYALQRSGLLESYILNTVTSNFQNIQ